MLEEGLTLGLPGRHRHVAWIGDARVGDHVCWTYDDDTRFWDAVVHYIADGLRDGQRVACYFPASIADDARVYLDGTEVAFAQAAAEGALIVGNTEDAYMPGGAFEPDLRITGYAAMADQAIADGFTALRVLGEATSLVDDAVASEAWPSYELRADLLTARMPMTALCAYDARRCDARALAVLRSVHGATFGARGCDGGFYVHADPSGVLCLGGEIDLACAGTIGDLVADAARDATEPVLDVSGVRFVDVAGLRAVVHGARALAGRDERARIRGASPALRRMWRLLDLDRSVEEVELA